MPPHIQYAVLYVQITSLLVLHSKFPPFACLVKMYVGPSNIFVLPAVTDALLVEGTRETLQEEVFFLGSGAH